LVKSIIYIRIQKKFGNHHIDLLCAGAIHYIIPSKRLSTSRSGETNVDSFGAANMIKLSYSTFGLTDLSFLDAIEAVDRAGYPGVELSFHRDQFNPLNATDEDIATLKRKLQTTQVKASSLPPLRISSHHPDRTNHP
jgi:hypothetical protein